MKTKTENKSKQTLLPWDPPILSYGWWKQSDGWWKTTNPNSPKTPSPVGEVEEAMSKSTIIVGKVKDICGEHACMLTNFLQILGVSNSDFIPHKCKSKDFYSHLILHVIKPDQLLHGQITSLLFVKPAPGVKLLSSLFLSFIYIYIYIYIYKIKI